MFGEFSVLALELLRDIFQIMEVTTLTACAIFHKRVVQFISQSISLGREDSENASIVELRIHQSLHQLFSQGSKGTVGDVELYFIGVEVDEWLAVSALSFAR